MPKALLRIGLRLILACCAALDGLFGEAAIYGGGDIGFVDSNGHFAMQPPQPELWFPILGFIALQGVLIFALIRLRD